MNRLIQSGARQSLAQPIAWVAEMMLAASLILPS